MESSKIKKEKQPSIGLALGSGGALAISHLGILEGFVEKNIKIDAIAGSSMGALIAGVYALGLDFEEAKKTALHYAKISNLYYLETLNIFHDSLIKNEILDDLLKDLFGNATFKDCKIPFCVDTVDLATGKVVVFKEGLIREAIKASSSIPGIFEPILCEDKLLVDGGLLENCPLDSLKKLKKLDIVIGSYVGNHRSEENMVCNIEKKLKLSKHHGLSKKLLSIKSDFNLLVSILDRSIDLLKKELFVYKLRESKPDMMFEIMIEDIQTFDFDKIIELEKIGQNAFKKQYPKLSRVIARKKNILNSR